MIWAVLIGNTRAVAALMQGQKVLRRRIVPTGKLRSASKSAAWAKSLRRMSEAEGVVVASVVPPVDRLVRRAIGYQFKKPPLFVTSRTAGIPVKLKRPSEVGADRLANAVAVKEWFGVPAIV